MVKLKDIIKENTKESSVFSWYKKEPFLLQDLRSYKTLVDEDIWKRYYKEKVKDGKYFRLLKLAFNFALSKVSLRKGMNTFPRYKRGSKGFILDKSFIDLLPEREKLQAKEAIETKNCFMVLFEHTFMTIPSEYINHLK